ncbi:MAG: Mg2 transporter protein CorA family protein [Candidatus Falkowbacteria bacterium GW2011_GWF2_39_8]|uniref:Mg2 transporter protein CorA family protein n=1 Tax=Candidatus Falkowbacteria bacterium GW2011_GWF2_39_8 TaxID=1618642 RepID=A0A0G0PWA9_9BACT|nr:MAG: Mg2 transporter protein CorA family protein [Candidatus Falkowbacteria bacterium GW2011_GWF2_39_8]
MIKNEIKITKNIQEVIIDNPRTLNHKIRWINVTNAGKKEIEYLRKKYNFQLPHLHASSANVFAQRPTVKHCDVEGYIFAIMHFPIFVNGTITATEIDFFIGHGYMITLHNGNMQALNEFFNLCKKDGDSLLTYQFESSTILLYELLEKLMHSCYPILDQNSLAINRVEEIIFAQEQKKAVTDILKLRHNITSFHKIMHSHKKILTKFMEMKSRLVPTSQLQGYYKKLIDHSITIWEIMESQKEIVEVLNSTNESLLNYRLSDIMKTLTIFSIISFYLTLIAATFSMRAEGMPFVDSRYGFWLIFGFMALVGVKEMAVNNN